MLSGCFVCIRKVFGGIRISFRFDGQLTSQNSDPFVFILHEGITMKATKFVLSERYLANRLSGLNSRKNMLQ